MQLLKNIYFWAPWATQILLNAESILAYGSLWYPVYKTQIQPLKKLLSARMYSAQIKILKPHEQIIQDKSLP